MVNREPYATSPAQLSEECGLPLLGQFEPESRFLERLGHLGEFALDPMRSAHIYHAILDTLGNPARPPVLWIASLPGSWEQAPCAVGIAETACSISEGAILAQVGDMHLPAPAGAVERLNEGVQSFVDNLMGRPMQFWRSDLAGVSRALPAPESDDPIPTMNLPEGDPEKGNRAVLVLSPVEEEGWNPPSHIVDAVLLVVSYRDHPLSHILWAKERIRSAGHRLVGLVAAGSSDGSKDLPSTPPARSRPAPPPPPPSPPPAGPESIPTPPPAPAKQIPKPPRRPLPPVPSGSESVVRVDWAARFSSGQSRGRKIVRRIARSWPWILVLGLIGGFAYTKFKPILSSPTGGEMGAAGDSSTLNGSTVSVDSVSAFRRDIAAAEEATPPAVLSPPLDGDEPETGAPSGSTMTPEVTPPAPSTPEASPERMEAVSESVKSAEDIPAEKIPVKEISAEEIPVEKIREEDRDWKAIDQKTLEDESWAAGEQRTRELETRIVIPPPIIAGDAVNSEAEGRPSEGEPAESLKADWVPEITEEDEGLPVDLPGWDDNRKQTPAPDTKNLSENQIPGLDPSLYPLTVQVAAFQSGDGALFEVDRLDALGYPADTLWVTLPEKGRYCRVVTGSFRNPEAALLLVKELQGHPDVGQAFIVTRGGRGNILWSLSHR
ncbi:MAG: SPOR domain-containing protein [Candidatus Eisenbacteria bacterium]|uniref:SPOR domain-containing protein n=1 Tax=Eiseniibacteriota bacterium TaxID=2212470 RepID=A0A948RS71_UNCEI|nr:SPOR domain-containing protein [Candidatus Eisenbacteria bacterium]MBU2689631.1 SPOR domain-containing protein [Candidatus Eisenbacteria bacterium]